MRHKMKEMDWRKFRRYHKQVGYKKGEIKDKWKAATIAQAFKNSKARWVGKKIFVWVDKGRECDHSDVISLTQTGEADTSYVSKDQAKRMLRGKHGLALSDAAKAETFGGEYSYIFSRRYVG